LEQVEGVLDGSVGIWCVYYNAWGGSKLLDDAYRRQWSYFDGTGLGGVIFGLDLGQWEGMKWEGMIDELPQMELPLNGVSAKGNFQLDGREKDSEGS